MAETVKFGLVLNSNVAESAKKAAEELAKIPGLAERSQKALDKARDPFARLRSTGQGVTDQLEKARKKLADLKANPQAVKDLQHINKELAKLSGHKEGLFSAFKGGVKGGLGLKDFGILTAAEAAGELLVEGGKKLVEIFTEGFKHALEKGGEEERRRLSLGLVLGKAEAKRMREEAERFAKLTEFSAGEVTDQMRSLMTAGLRGQAATQAYALAGDLAARQGGGAAAMQSSLELVRKISLKEGISEKMLIGLGFQKSGFYKQIAGQLGISEKSAKEKVSQGKVDPQRILNALSDIVEQAQGGKLGTGAVAMGSTLAGRMHKLKELPGDYFEKLAESPAFAKFSDALGKALEKLDPESDAGKRIFGALEHAFDRMAGFIENMLKPENIDKFATGVGTVLDFVGKLPEYLNTILKISEAIAAVWAGKKIVDGITSAAGAMGKLASAAAGGGGKLGAAGGVLAAGAVGWEIGTFIDKYTGLSDKIAGLAPGASDNSGPIRAVLKGGKGVNANITNNINASIYPAENDTNHTGQVVAQSIAASTSNGMERIMSEAGM